MLKLAVAGLALALAGTASADGWRSLRVDGSSEEAFAKSLEAFRDKLSPTRRYEFGAALREIWRQGAKAAEAEHREYTADEYYRQLDGLRYGDVVKTNTMSSVERREDSERRDAPDRQVWEPYRHQDASAAYWTIFGGGGDGPPRGSPSLGGPTPQ